MELLPLANLMPDGFEGIPSAFSSDPLSQEFYSLLLNQMFYMEEGDGRGDGCQRTSRFAPLEELLSPQTEEGPSFLSYVLNPLLTPTLNHPMDFPEVPEGQELIPSIPQPTKSQWSKSAPIHLPYVGSTTVQGDPIPISEKVEEMAVPLISRYSDSLDIPGSNLSSPRPDLLSQESFISQKQKVAGGLHNPTFDQVGLKEMASDLPFFKLNVSEVDQKVVNRMNLHHEGPSSLFQIERKDMGSLLMTDKMEQGAQMGTTPSNPPPASSVRGHPNLTVKPEFLEPPDLNGATLDSINEGHRSASLRNDPTLSEACLHDNGVRSETKTEPFIPEKLPNLQKGFSPKVESSEIYHQVSRKILWSVQNGVERVKLRLDPPELGHIYLEVTKEKEAVRATFWTEAPTTKELLDAHRIELRKILQENGFKLERFDVFVQQETERFMERREFSFLGGQQEHRETKEDSAVQSSEPPDRPSAAVRPNPGVSYYINRII